jgi:DNA-binding response OmpR family regulator
MATEGARILVVDDDLQLLKFITFNLQLEGYKVFTASEGEQTLEMIQGHPLDLVLLDLLLPGMDGFTVCQRIRSCWAVPIIILTACGRDQDKVRALDLGADDYLTKPFSLEELLARIRAVLRRSQFTSDEQAYALQTTILVGDLSIDNAQHLVRLADRELALTPSEYRLLFLLAQHAGHIVPQDQLLEYAWGEEYKAEGHVLQVNMNRLRNKLEPDRPHPQYLLTKPGIGYLLANPAGRQATMSNHGTTSHDLVLSQAVSQMEQLLRKEE